MVNQFSEILTMGEEKAEPAGGEAGSLSTDAAVSRSPDRQNEPVIPSEREVLHDPADAASAHPSKQAAAGEMSEAAASDRTRSEARPTAREVVVVPFGEAGGKSEAGARQRMFGRFAAMAAVVTLATGAGAFGGALATATLFHGTEVVSNSPALEASIARIDADILSLKASLEYGSKLGHAQFSKTAERLDKIERAQTEPAAKLARLSEAVDRLRAAPVPLPSPVAVAPPAKDVTGSISPASASATSRNETPKNDTAKNDTAKNDAAKTDAAKTDAAKPEAGRLPMVEGWVLRDVVHGGALIDGRRGMYEVYAGDIIPGLGRIDAIRRQDGRWVVVTSKGLIVAR
jgi:hypothetical protein